MSRPQLELADIVRANAASYRQRFSVPSSHKRILSDIAACRTAKLGGHVELCDECDHKRVAYNSCGNRHCPKCQASARAEWLEARASDLLPVEYFHVVFTIPASIARIALRNKRIVYNILFRAASETLKEIAADPRHLGAKVGVVAVLHTWGQNLLHHPHLHCVVPGGGLSPDGSSWISCRPGFFLPVRVLSRVFRGKFLDLLRRAFEGGKLSFSGKLAELESHHEFKRHLDAAYRTEWVVYAKRPFGGPEQVLKYLARYTHRVAISNQRLCKMSDERITFRWKDYANGSKQKLMTLDALEFLRRFLLHALPRGFVRIRYYGLLANRARVENLDKCRAFLGVEPGEEQHSTSEPHDCFRCPACVRGKLVRLEFKSFEGLARILQDIFEFDTS